MSRRGREALGEEDVSQHRRELEQWVEEKKKEKRERERPKLEGLFLCRSFSALNVQDGQIRRGEGVTSGTVYLTVCVHECVRACTSSSCVTSASVMGGTLNAGRLRLCSL